MPDLVDACSVCRRQHDAAEHVDELRTLLGDVARMTRELGYHLMPGSGIPGEKVSTSRTGSPTPARLDVLSLIGPGGREVRRDARNLAPLVRRWSTVTTYTVPTPDGPRERELRTWHAELVTGAGGRPVLVADDDQVGAIPPAEWCDEWVRRWRLILQHGARTMPAGRWVDYQPTDDDQDKRLTRAGLAEWMRMSRGRPHMLRAVAAFLALRVAYADAVQRVAPALLGVRRDGDQHARRAEDALAGARPPAIAHDPAAAEWIVRYGAARTAAAVEVDAHYLQTWLPMVTGVDDPDDQVGLGRFAAELRAMRKELQHVLGETKDAQWIGRCPVKLLDDEGHETGRRCGAGLWHDAHRPGEPIECPRCYTRTPERQWLTLGARIREAWPIDTRRRYTGEDKRHAELAATMPTCRGCERTMAVDWRPSPARGDREPMWRPARLFCPAGCLAGGTVAAA